MAGLKEEVRKGRILERKKLMEDDQRGREREGQWMSMSCASQSLSQQEASVDHQPRAGWRDGFDRLGFMVQSAEDQKNCQRGKMSGHSDPNYTSTAEPRPAQGFRLQG